MILRARTQFSPPLLSAFLEGTYIEECFFNYRQPPMKAPLSPLSKLFAVLFFSAALLTIIWGPYQPAIQVADQLLYQLMGGSSTTAGADLTIPIWSGVLNSLLWLITTLFWCALLPRFSTPTAIAFALIVIASLVLLQILSQQRYQLWLPQGLLAQFLLIATPLLLLWSRVAKSWQRLLKQRDQALLELAEIKLQAGKLDQAGTHLQQCHPTREVTELGYQLALQQEQKRSYQAATKTYQWLASFDPGYQDVKKKACSPLAATTAIDSSDYLRTQTLNISEDQLRQPRLGRYRIEHELGRGAMGTVYLGVDPKIARRVAIKTLSYNMFEPSDLDEVKQRFFREAEAAGRLSHPNIVTIFDVGEEPDLCFIAMDYVDGDSLRSYTTSNNLLDVATIYQLIAQVADALDYAHRQNIVHRDIKPGNLLYDANQELIKVADFGIARITDNSSTKTGDILGSPLYMSPEQLKGQKVTGASDIYSLGVTLYQLLSGEPPYFGDSIANLAYQVLNTKYKSVRSLRPELPASAPRIINKAMAKEPDKRFSSAAEMAETLRKSLKKDFGI